MALSIQFSIIILVVARTVAIIYEDAHEPCDPLVGSSGATSCFSDKLYNSKYQWGTCVTDTFIRAFSKGKYYCRGLFTRYCYYQCMLESHDLDEACDPYIGPSGTTGCFLDKNYYTKYQWGTCVTDTFIQTFSKEEYHCRDRSATYCYYQCMLESHSLDEGPVYDDCACNPDAEKIGDHREFLPEWCYTPNGTSCSWYTDCLDKRHDCSSQGYAKKIARKLCGLFSANQHKISTQGNRWINAVHQCLQTQLVPLLRPYKKVSCEGIMSKAFKTYSPCYLHPNAGEPSICDLKRTDWAKVFWTIRGAFVDTTLPSLKGMLDVILGCSVNALEGVLDIEADTGMRMGKLTVGNVKKNPLDEYSDQAKSIGNQVASQLMWKQKGVHWFVFVANSSNTDEIGFNILLGSVSKYDVNAVGIPEANINKTLDELAHAMGNWKLHLRVPTGWKMKVFNACLDFACQDTYHNLIPNITIVSGGIALSFSFQSLVGTLICSALIL